TARRREIQDRFNLEHSITPSTIRSAIKETLTEHLKATGWFPEEAKEEPATAEAAPVYHSVDDLRLEIKELERQMYRAAEELEFEKAAQYRDRVKELTELLLAC
ncbi:MAG: UvrB/UvrC motif-containing protein, partial [Thermodesulfobacteriota bacterium]